MTLTRQLIMADKRTRALTTTDWVRHTFQPSHIFRGGHAQTLAGLYLPSPTPPYAAQPHVLSLDDDDRIVLHDDQPSGWQAGQSIALLVHGLAGCHGSPYMRRIANKLNARGIRTFRLDMRGMGASEGLAMGVAHAGRHGDVLAALSLINRLHPESAVTLLGFSLGGSLVLNALADNHSQALDQVQRAIVVSPPADLHECCDGLRRGFHRGYDRYLLRLLWKKWRDTGRPLPDRKPKTLVDFDNLITAPVSGFRDAYDYYAQASCGPRLTQIRHPVRILAAEDDPMVPITCIKKFPRAASISLFVTPTGGHLGFIARSSAVPDGRWMDETVVHWTCEPWAA